MYDIVIIGAGVSGSALARSLSKFDLDILVVDKENDVSCGASKANSGISHAGYDPEPGTLMAKYNVKGNQMLPKICQELSVPYSKVGALVVAFSEQELPALQQLYDKGIKNGILPQYQAILNQEQLRHKEPNISEQALAAYWCSETGIISSFELCVGLMENAIDNGVVFSPNTQVKSITKIDEGFIIETNNLSCHNIKTRFIVNAAGGYADKIHAMLSKPNYTIKSRRGEYYILDKKYGHIANSVIFQCPNEKGKGVLISPTGHGNLIIGPNAYYVDDPYNVETTLPGLLEVKKLAERSIPNLPLHANIRNFSGNRAESSLGDFIVGPVFGIPGFFEIAGIHSPGLTSSPAIAEDMVLMLEKGGLTLIPKKSFNPYRKVIHLDYLSWDEKDQLIASNPLYGRMVCHCEKVSEGEIIDAVKRTNGGRSVEGIKKRTRVCAGTCQGSSCMARIVEIIARELNIDPLEVNQDKNGSYLIFPKGETLE